MNSQRVGHILDLAFATKVMSYVAKFFILFSIFGIVIVLIVNRYDYIAIIFPALSLIASVIFILKSNDINKFVNTSRTYILYMLSISIITIIVLYHVGESDFYSVIMGSISVAIIFGALFFYVGRVKS